MFANILHLFCVYQVLIVFLTLIVKGGHDVLPTDDCGKIAYLLRSDISEA